MAVEVLSYDVKHYNSLSPLWDASERLGPVSDRAEAFGEIAKVFLEHRVQDLLGAILLHNHFSMGPAQKLVALGNVATPWDANAAAEALMGVNSSSFRFVNGAVTPYEFTHGTKELYLESEELQAFLAALLPVLVKWGLDNLLGVCVLPDISGPVGTEFTSGNANITLPVDLSPNAGSIEAMWHFSHDADTSDFIAFGSDPAAPVAFGQCKLRCKVGTEGHQKEHKRNT
ncbi:hypothetical protein F5883DRAFT_578563 [Diaporthe sp. PMI_573]|nr:hypothetical protein F5883DRAFT_578563 [Diaporthaceae sp. PMI_573]